MNLRPDLESCLKVEYLGLASWFPNKLLAYDNSFGSLAHEHFTDNFLARDSALLTQEI